MYTIYTDTSGTTSSSSASITGHWNTDSHYTTPGNTEMKVSTTDKGDGVINPSLYFRFVKSKFSKLQQQELSLRLNKLKKMIMASKEIKQQALYEQLSLQLAITVREQEALVAGCSMRVDKKVINKFIDRVTDKCVKLSILEEFPRTIPASVRDKLKKIQDIGIFDEYWVLYTDYTEEKQLKTNKSKIKEKDPILFGSFKFSPDTFYYITDWIDKYCDITMSKFIDAIQVDDPEFELDRIPDINDESVSSILQEVTNRYDRLKNTKADNYRDLMAEEDKERGKKPKKKSLIDRIRNK